TDDRRRGRPTQQGSNVITDLSRDLREALVKQLIVEEALTSDAWVQAARAVPREAFVSSYFEQIDQPGRITTYKPRLRETAEPSEWLKEIYTNQTLITQLNCGTWPEDVVEEPHGSPSSSSTLPSLVLRMLEELDVRDGDKVLEIATGTGYSTALLCERLGAENVTSIEYDSEVARRAADALNGLGYRPKLITGDGLDGDPDSAPFDRIIATCSVRAIPATWFEQAKPGTTILATLVGSMFGNALAKLSVTDAKTATGRILPGYTSFMPARSQTIPLDPKVNLLDDVPDEPTNVGPDIFDDWTGRYIAQLKAPYVVHSPMLTMDSDDELNYIVDQRDGSIAILTPRGDGWQVRQSGPRRLWDEIAEIITEWRAGGSPFMDRFLIHAEPDAYTVTIGGTDINWRTEPGAAIT
ncbi:MAG: ATP-grasp peptide maturase system methyltransferase, partial [Mycobacteriales bacterium]